MPLCLPLILPLLWFVPHPSIPQHINPLLRPLTSPLSSTALTSGSFDSIPVLCVCLRLVRTLLNVLRLDALF